MMSFYGLIIVVISSITLTCGKVTVGINLSGLEEGSKIPGRANYDYAVPSAAEWEYFASRGIKLVRLPFRWERIQPNVSGALDPGYLALVKTQLQMAANNSMSVVLDCHNFGKAYGHQLNNGTLTPAQFGDLWSRLATEFVGVQSIIGYDIMNEPNHMPTTTAWPEAAQVAINAIRKVDTTTPLYIEGNNWSGAQNWSENNPTLHTLTDKLCTNKRFVQTQQQQGCIVWSSHCYLDRDSSGTHFNWTAEVEAGVTVNTGTDRLKDFASWLQQHKFTHAHIGELGAGRDNVGWLESLNNSMTLMAQQNWELTYWSAGPWFSGGYPYDVDAQTVVVNGTKAQRDSIQMAVLSQHAGSPAPSIYFLAGPTRGYTAAASAPFSLTYRGYITKAIKFVCNAKSVDGSHSMNVFSTTCAVGWNCDAEFNVTVPTSQSYTIACTNDGSLQDAPTLQYNSSTDLFLGAAANAANIFSLRHLYTGYDGPALTLRRATDNMTMNFTFGADGELDTLAISKWCADPCLTFVDTWFDQSPNKFHAGKVVSDFHGGGNHNVSVDDQPQLVLVQTGSNDITNIGGGDGLRAHIHFNGQRRMDAKSPIDGLTGQTLLTVMSTNGTGNQVNNSDRLLSWAFVQNLVFPDGGGYITPDSQDSLPLNISHTPGYHRYAGRWQANLFQGKSTYKDGEQTAIGATIDAAEIHFSYRDVVNIGWFRWWSPVFVGDVRELITFSGALSDGDLKRFDQSESAWLAKN
eukprot:m.123178 g.123178  ORF g.123178 m.123178 type:complete len:744 (+) comp28970_c2_seq1:134-2365(+)